MSAQTEIIHVWVEAFNRGDFESVMDTLDPGVELSEWPNAPGARTYHGHDGVRQALASWFDAWEWLTIEIEDVVESGDRALVTSHQRARGKGSAVEVENISFDVYTFRDGKITRAQLFTEREPALEAAGISAGVGEEKR